MILFFTIMEKYIPVQPIVNGKLHGEEKNIIHLEIQSVDTYNNGIQYGKSKDYYESGQLRTESKIEIMKQSLSTITMILLEI